MFLQIVTPIFIKDFFIFTILSALNWIFCTTSYSFIFSLFNITPRTAVDVGVKINTHAARFVFESFEKKKNLK